jgi:hypothetical protein
MLQVIELISVNHIDHKPWLKSKAMQKRDVLYEELVTNSG